MNARQKAKKYKDMYLDLVCDPLRQEARMWKRLYYTIVNDAAVRRCKGTLKIDTLRFEKFYPKEYLEHCSTEFLLERTKESIAEEIAKNMDKYAKFIIDYGSDGNRLTCDIQVVNIRESAKRITNVTEEE
jgi:hypothetical protein